MIIWKNKPEQDDQDWNRVVEFVKDHFSKKPDLNAVLFLIGVQELGRGKKHFSKEEKQDLMHIATCKLLSYEGFYELEGTDAEGWPHWKSLQPLPHLDLASQEKLLKMLAFQYFQKEVWHEDQAQS